MTPSEWRNNVIVPLPEKRRRGACEVQMTQGYSAGVGGV